MAAYASCKTKIGWNRDGFFFFFLTQSRHIILIITSKTAFIIDSAMYCVRACFDAMLLPQSYQYPNLSEGADSVGGQTPRDEEFCPFCGETNHGWVWRKVPEGETWSGKFTQTVRYDVTDTLLKASKQQWQPAETGKRRSCPSLQRFLHRGKSRFPAPPSEEGCRKPAFGVWLWAPSYSMIIIILTTYCKPSFPALLLPRRFGGSVP